MQSTQDTMPTTDEETFNQWATRRLGLYQQLEQHTQASIANSLQLANDFAMKLEQEEHRLLARYKKHHTELQQQIEQARQELNELRGKMTRERQEHAEQLEHMRQQAQEKIRHEHQQAMQAIEKRRLDIKQEHDAIIQQAYHEREQIIAETQERLAALLHMPPAVHRTPFVDDNHKPMDTIKTTEDVVAIAVNGGQDVVAVAHENMATPADVSVDDVPLHTPAEADETDETDETAETDETDEARETDETDETDDRSDPAPDDDGTEPIDTVDTEQRIELFIEGVESFILASEIIDLFEQQQGIDMINLVQYEQHTLHISVQPMTTHACKTLIDKTAAFHAILTIDTHDDATLWLRYRTG